jgi:hypothetical protein
MLIELCLPVNVVDIYYLSMSVNELHKQKTRGLLFLATKIYHLRWRNELWEQYYKEWKLSNFISKSNVNCCKTVIMASTENVEASSTEPDKITIELKNG